MIACFLDRDGVVIKDKNYLKNLKDIKYTTGIFEGLTKITDKKYSIFIIKIPILSLHRFSCKRLLFYVLY